MTVEDFYLVANFGTACFLSFMVKPKYSNSKIMILKTQNLRSPQNKIVNLPCKDNKLKLTGQVSTFLEHILSLVFAKSPQFDNEEV